MLVTPGCAGMACVDRRPPECQAGRARTFARASIPAPRRAYRPGPFPHIGRQKASRNPLGSRPSITGDFLHQRCDNCNAPMVSASARVLPARPTSPASRTRLSHCSENPDPRLPGSALSNWRRGRPESTRRRSRTADASTAVRTARRAASPRADRGARRARRVTPQRRAQPSRATPTPYPGVPSARASRARPAAVFMDHQPGRAAGCTDRLAPASRPVGSERP